MNYPYHPFSESKSKLSTLLYSPSDNASLLFYFSIIFYFYECSNNKAWDFCGHFKRTLDFDIFLNLNIKTVKI